MNAFEIRESLLRTAKDMLDRQFETQAALAQAAFVNAVAVNAAGLKDLGDYMPKMYGADEIISIAETMQKFVDGNRKAI